MKTSKWYLNYGLVLFLSTLFASATAQSNAATQQTKKDMIEAQKVAFITQQIELTPKESQTFWPVYNEYKEKSRELIKANRQQMMAYTKLVNPTEKQAEEIVDAQIIHEQKMLDLKKTYHIQFKALLPATKLIKLYKSEKDFNKFLLKQMREKKKEGINIK